MLHIRFDNSYARECQGLYVPWQGQFAPAPKLVLLNRPLAEELGLDTEALASPEGLAMLTGSAMPAGAAPLAMAYAGHQFGGFSPQLGDGRALLIGEVIDKHGRRRDIHLKGSGPTPFARGGDGKAALGPVLREYIMGEAMHALGIPTTRALSAVLTGETIWRQDGPLPGAVLARVASSHIRVGTFQFFAARGDRARLERLAEHTIRRHDPDLAHRPDRYQAFFMRVIERQMRLVAQWMAVGFVHGVMNTDNCAISGETIDYGPCAMLDAYNPRAVFSSIDHFGRYAYGNQPLLARWNLARLAEALLPLIAPEDPQKAVGELQAMLDRAETLYAEERRRLFAAKLGIGDPTPADDSLIDAFLDLLAAAKADFTLSFRRLIQLARGGAGPEALGLAFLLEPQGQAWLSRWQARLAGDPAAVARMERANPVIIPRNHRVEEALAAAHAGNLTPLERLLAALAEPLTEKPEFADLTDPPPPDFGPYVTFCGT